MERLPGKPSWLGRPTAGLGAYLAGAYTTLQWGQRCLDVVWPKALLLWFFSPLCIRQQTPWATVTPLHGKFLLTLPPRALVFAWAKGFLRFHALSRRDLLPPAS